MQHHVYVTEMEPRFQSSLRSSDCITLAPNLDYLENVKTEDVERHDSTEGNPAQWARVEVTGHWKMPLLTLPELVDSRAPVGTGACVWKVVTISLEVLITANISKQLLKL